MKPLSHLLLSTLLAFSLAAPAARAAQLTADFKEGKPAFKSMGPLAFGPEGILFVADTKSAAIVAIATGDTKAAAGSKPLKIEGINQKIAGLLGASAEQLLIDDLAVNPESHNVYLAVSRGRGPDAIPVLVRATTGSELEVVSLDKVTGTLSAPGRGGQATDTAIESGKISGDEISFTVTREFNGNKLVAKYSGKISGDAIKGKIETERDGNARSRDWEAKREGGK